MLSTNVVLFVNAALWFIFFAFGSYGASLDSKGPSTGEKYLLAIMFGMGIYNFLGFALG